MNVIIININTPFSFLEAVNEAKAEQDEIVANGAPTNASSSSEEKYAMPNSIVGVGDTGNGLVPSTINGDHQQGGSMVRPISVNHSHHHNLPSPGIRPMYGE